MYNPYIMGERSALASVMWRAKGLYDYDKIISKEAFERLADFLEDIAPNGEARDMLRRIRETEASAEDRI